MRRRALLFALPLVLALPASANVLSNGHITLTLADNASGATATMDRVDSISWNDGMGGNIADFVSNGGTVNCNDPPEFFGQAYGDVDGTTLQLVAQGSKAKWTSGDAFHGTSKTTGRDDCVAPSGKVKTTYTLFAAKARQNMIKVVRTFTFNGAAKDQAFNLRAYAPRLPMGKYGSIFYPGPGGVTHRVTVNTCPTACVLSDWDGTWFADDSGIGISGMMVIRDKSSTASATLDGDFDSFSNSNVTAIVLARPSGGWKGTVTETEYLCFYDENTWFDKTKMPKGCQVK